MAFPSLEGLASGDDAFFKLGRALLGGNGTHAGAAEDKDSERKNKSKTDGEARHHPETAGGFLRHTGVKMKDRSALDKRRVD